VQDGNALLLSRRHGECMKHKNTQNKTDNALRASVIEEMAKPRMAKSAKIAELKLNVMRIPEPPSTTIPGTVKKIIPSPRPSQPEKAQITVAGSDHRHRNLRFENTLTDEHGEDVKLKKGAHVNVTITEDPER
jgi:hypothetical protein